MTFPAPDHVIPASTGGWQAQLELGFIRRPVGTVLKRVSHKGPLRVQRPFYPEAGLPHVYLLHPPGGVVGSDCLDVRIKMQAGSQALLTSPGATKFYRSAGDTAQLRQTILVEAGGSLEWFPQENIIFSGAHLNALTRIDLVDEACFMGWEINCLGCPSSDESFEHGRLYSRLALYRNNRPLLSECQRVQNRAALQAPNGLRGYPMLAMFIATPCIEAHLEMVREVLAHGNAGFPIAATLVDGVLIVRALAEQSEALQQQLIPIWQALRPALIKRPAILPRIWAT